MVLKRGKVKGATAAVLGLGLYSTWVFCVLQRGAVSLLPLVRVPALLIAAALCLPGVVMLLLPLMAPRRFSSFTSRLHVIVPLVACVGTGLIVMAYRQTFFDRASLAIAGCVLAGCGYAYLAVLWLNVLNRFGDLKEIAVYLGAGIALSGLFLFLIAIMPPRASLIVVVVLPLLSAVGLIVSSGRMNTTPEIEDKVPGSQPILFVLQVVALQLGAVVLNVSGGEILVDVSNPGAPSVYLFGGAATIVLFMILARYVDVQTPLHVRYRVPLLLTIAGFMALTLTARYDAGSRTLDPMFSWVLMMINSGFVRMQLVSGARETRYRATSIFAGGIIFALLAIFGGQALISIIASPPNVILLVLVYLLIITMVVVPTAPFQRILAATGVSPSKTISERCAVLSAEHGLTSREEEILCLLMHGRSLPRIQKDLVIASGTAKAHVGHIYRKLGVHARQELLDLMSGSEETD